jgi:hypothetical protein
LWDTAVPGGTDDTMTVATEDRFEQPEDGFVIIHESSRTKAFPTSECSAPIGGCCARPDPI